MNASHRVLTAAQEKLKARRASPIGTRVPLPWIGGLIAVLGCQVLLLVVLGFTIDPRGDFFAYQSQRELLFGDDSTHVGIVRPILWVDTALVAALWWTFRQQRRTQDSSRFVFLIASVLLLFIAWTTRTIGRRMPPLEVHLIYRTEQVVSDTPSSPGGTQKPRHSGRNDEHLLMKRDVGSESVD